MKKITIAIIFILIIITNNNYQELSNLAIITNISITKSKNKYSVTFQEILPIKEDNKTSKEYKYYTSTSYNLKKAFSKINNISTKKIYLEHLENIIINSNTSDSIYELKSILNDLDNFNIVLTNSNPNKILKYSNNYRYINSIAKKNISFQKIKKNLLENKESKIPIIELKNNNIIFIKYKKLGGTANA